LARLVICTVEFIAMRSKRAGRQGIKTKSASWAARAAALSEWGAVSIITRPASAALARQLIGREWL
jgi:hypothetical protein